MITNFFLDNRKGGPHVYSELLNKTKIYNIFRFILLVPIDLALKFISTSTIFSFLSVEQSKSNKIL